jgi:hypothetical protein
MEFATIHQLSLEFDLPARVVRYRFHQLRQGGKLFEGADWRRDDFVDDQHFVWKINPLSFIRETGLRPVSGHEPTIIAPDKVAKSDPVVNQPVNDPHKAVNNPVNQPEPSATKPAPADDKVSTESPARRFEHEVIDFLKDQIRVKDEQIRERDDQLRAVNDMNVKLMGATLQQAKKIEDLLRLSAGQPDVDTKDGNQGGDVGDTPVNETSEAGNQPVNHAGTVQSS